MARISLFPRPVKEPKAYSEKPSWFMGSLPEWCVYEALLKLGMKDKFTYQSPKMGGRLAKGGAVLDFEIPSLGLGINIQSTYYHYATTPQRVAGEMQRAQLESQGIKVIYITETNALRDPVYFVTEALRGIEHR